MKAALVFDLDDTLYPERDFVRSGFRAVDRWLEERHGIRHFAPEAERVFAAGVRGRIFDEALGALGLAQPQIQILVPQMTAVYRAHRANLTLFPDARWALERFARSHRLGLITDGHARTQRNKVAALGIGGAFVAAMFTDDLGRGHWKPSAAPFQRMMAALEATADACIYVGDNPAKDFVAPNRLGWRTVRVVRAEGEHARVAGDGSDGHQAQHTVGSLHELEDILRS